MSRCSISASVDVMPWSRVLWDDDDKAVTAHDTVTAVILFYDTCAHESPRVYLGV